MLFEKFKGEGFEAWKSCYRIIKPVSIKGIINRPVLECTIMYENSFFIDWKHVTTFTIPNRLIEVYYAPGAESLVMFPGGKTFTTFDFHLQPELLESYRGYFPALDRFLQKVERNEPARLFDSLQFTSPAIDQTIKTFITYQFLDELAPKYYEHLVHIFIIQLLELVANFTRHKRNILPSDCEKAIEAKRLLTIDFEKSYTINGLCRILHTNPYSLKTTFRHLFNTSIGRYKKLVLMEKAKFLLTETNKTIDEISIELGYSSQQSFTAAFRNFYKTPPSYWRKTQ